MRELLNYYRMRINGVEKFFKAVLLGEMLALSNITYIVGIFVNHILTIV